MTDELEVLTLLKYSVGILFEGFTETANNLILTDDPANNRNTHHPITLL
jgi:hypothetical protein